MKILVVAELAPIVVGLEHFFTRAGYATLTSWTAENAIETIESDAGIGIVIWDLELRGHTQMRTLLSKATQVQRFNDNGAVLPPTFIFLAGPSDRADSVAETQIRQFAHLLSPGNLVRRPLDREDLMRRVRAIAEPETDGEASPASEVPKPSVARAAPSSAAAQNTSVDAQMHALDHLSKRLDSTLAAITQRLRELEEQANGKMAAIGAESSTDNSMRVG